jgi:hypothetical protein
LGRANGDVFRLTGKAGKILWAGEFNPKVRGSASTEIADKGVESLLAAIKKQK